MWSPIFRSAAVLPLQPALLQAVLLRYAAAAARGVMDGSRWYEQPQETVSL